MSKPETPLWRHLLPWVVSAGALLYVFGFAIDWESIPRVTERANLPLFVAVTVADKLVFFLVFAIVQASAIRRFVEPVSIRAILSLKGAAELLRLGGNLISDGAFLYGISQLVRHRMAALVAVLVIPFAAHFFVLLCQASLVLPFLQGGPRGNLDVTIGVTMGWTTVAAGVALGRLGYWHSALERVGFQLDGSLVRRLLPIVGWFALFAAFDVTVQGLATRAFGVPIGWLELAARIPFMYVALAIPSFGNFGTRELAWATLFADEASSEALVAFALWTNAVFAVMHALIGSLFIGRAIALVRDRRIARRQGEPERGVRAPILRDAIDP